MDCGPCNIIASGEKGKIPLILAKNRPDLGEPSVCITELEGWFSHPKPSLENARNSRAKRDPTAQKNYWY